MRMVGVPVGTDAYQWYFPPTLHKARRHIYCGNSPACAMRRPAFIISACRLHPPRNSPPHCHPRNYRDRHTGVQRSRTMGASSHHRQRGRRSRRRSLPQQKQRATCTRGNGTPPWELRWYGRYSCLIRKAATVSPAARASSAQSMFGATPSFCAKYLQPCPTGALPPGSSACNRNRWAPYFERTRRVLGIRQGPPSQRDHRIHHDDASCRARPQRAGDQHSADQS